jgi:hypothetical protein
MIRPIHRKQHDCSILLLGCINNLNLKEKYMHFFCICKSFKPLLMFAPLHSLPILSSNLSLHFRTHEKLLTDRIPSDRAFLNIAPTFLISSRLIVETVSTKPTFLFTFSMTQRTQPEHQLDCSPHVGFLLLLCFP